MSDDLPPDWPDDDPAVVLYKSLLDSRMPPLAWALRLRGQGELGQAAWFASRCAGAMLSLLEAFLPERWMHLRSGTRRGEGYRHLLIPTRRTSYGRPVLVLSDADWTGRTGSTHGAERVRHCVRRVPTLDGWLRASAREVARW